MLPQKGDYTLAMALWCNRDAENPILTAKLGWGLHRRVKGEFHIAHGMTD